MVPETRNQLTGSATWYMKNSPAVSPLVSVDLRVQMAAVYEHLLTELVFKGREDDRSNLKAHQRTLRSDEAYLVLAIIWKESPCIPDDELKRQGMVRQFTQRELTVFGLARHLSQSVDHLAALNSRIRSIVMAATEFGLVDEQRNSRKVSLRGTELLHQFMTALGNAYATLISGTEHRTMANERWTES